MLALAAWQGAPCAEEAAAPAAAAAAGAVPPAPPAATVDAVYRKGVAYLLTHQNKQGSWGSFESARVDEVYLGTSASHTAFGDATTALCLMALLAPAREDAAAAQAVEKGAHYLFKKPPVLRATADALYSVWTQIYVLEAASAVLREPRLKAFHSDARKSAKKQIEVLGQIQGSEGGFGYYDFNFAASHPTGSESCSFTTAAALLALDHAKAAGVEAPPDMLKDAQRSLSRLRLGDGAYIYGIYAQNVPQRLFNNVKGSLGRSQVCNLALWRYHGGLKQDDLRAGLENLFKYHPFIEMGKGRPIPHESWYFTAGYYLLLRPLLRGAGGAGASRARRQKVSRWLAEHHVPLAGPGRLVVGLPDVRLLQGLRHGVRAADPGTGQAVRICFS